MSVHISEKANAKINLFLDVLSRRPDGYHTIDGVMQSVTLSDLVTVSWEPSAETRITLRAAGSAGEMPTDGKNLAWRAAEHFLRQTCQTGTVDILLEKHIPMAAGLAGGSSDAAAVLRALNRLTGAKCSPDDLCGIGSALGADVPFCIRGGATRTQGIGDRMTPIRGLAGCKLVVACGGEGISTPWAYGGLDELYGNFLPARKSDPALESLICALGEGDLSGACEHMKNVFEEAVVPVRPYVSKIREIMTRSGAIRAMMSGSGPSVFGVFREDTDDAETALEALSREGIPAWICSPAEEVFSES